MKEIPYFLMKIRYRLSGRNTEVKSEYFRKMGMTIGENCHICDNITTSEPHLISIGNNVTTAARVVLVTHDNSISKVIPDTTDLFGKITIGDNCFVGESAIILYGVTLANNIIVAAGSVVTKSFSEENVIIGGNPARVISTWEKFTEKSKDYVWNLDNTSRECMIEQTKKGVKTIQR